MDDRNFFVVRIKGNDEFILAEYDDENSAKRKMSYIGRHNKSDNGVIAVVKAKRYSKTELDYRKREIVDVYDKWLKKVLSR